MSIQSEITLLQNTKKNLKSAIMEKGVTVYPSDIFSTYPTRISQISMTPGDKDNLFSELIDRSITSFVIPNGTSSIRSFCFSDCLSLTSVTIPNTVTTIGSNSFTKTGLTSVTIPESVTFIGKLAFFLSNSLTSITCLSETPPALGNYNNAFDNTNNCPIYVPEESVQAYKTAWPDYASRIQAIVVPTALKWTSSDGTQEISIACEDLAEAGTLAQNDRTTADTGDLMKTVEGSAEIGDCVTTIGYSAFENCSLLTSINIPDSVTNIESGAFAHCFALTSVNIPDSVTAIGDSAFSGCSGLTSVTLPSSVTSIEGYTFSDCTSLASVTIPSGVTRIGNYAFFNCTSLTSVTINADTPPTLGYIAFDGANNCPIYVPEDSVETYKTAWPAYADRIQAIKKYFVKLTDTSTVPTGTYLIVNETTSNVMESSLIKDTTSYSTGLNTFNNGVGLKQVEIVDNAIEATPEMLNYAVSYNVGSDKSTLSWTDPQDGTVYYLGNYQNGWVYGNDRFTQWNITNSNGHFKYGSRYLDIRKTNEISYFGWALAAYTNSIVLYKLEE